MFLCGTIHFPNLNPVGGWSITALLLCGMLAYAVFFRRPQTHASARTISKILPILMLAMAAITPGNVVFYTWFHARSFPNAPEYVAGVLWLAFGFGFSVGNLRFPQRATHILTIILLHIFVPAVLIQALAFIGMGRFWKDEVITVSIVASLVLNPILVYLIDMPYRAIRRKTSAGTCYRCGYDLRGLTERRCPECGLSFETPAEALAPSVDCGIMVHDGPRQSSGC